MEIAYYDAELPKDTEFPRYERWQELSDQFVATPAKSFSEVAMKMMVGVFVDEKLPADTNFVVEEILYRARAYT